MTDIPYTTVRNGNRFFEPRGRMRKAGFEPRPLGPDNEASRKRAWDLLERWMAIRDGRDVGGLTREQAAQFRIYPVRSVGAAWQEWVQTTEWAKLASSNRNKVWWPAWLKRIEPVFGDCNPNSITFREMSDWHAKIVASDGLDVAHKAMKIWRALWKIMQALRYTQLTDPSAKVTNRAPRGRTERYAHGEAMIRVKTAWRAGYRGLACLMMIGWDTGFSPVDCRTLRDRHLRADPKTGRLFFDRTDMGRAKSGVAVIGTLTRFGDWLVRRYLAELSVARTPDAILFRTRRGTAYSETKLTQDYAALRARVDPEDRRQLRDWRRSGIVETFTGGAKPVDVSEKFGNTIGHSNVLFKTYNPVDLEKVRRADDRRLEGRRRRNSVANDDAKNRSENALLSKGAAPAKRSE